MSSLVGTDRREETYRFHKLEWVFEQFYAASGYTWEYTCKIYYPDGTYMVQIKDSDYDKLVTAVKKVVDDVSEMNWWKTDTDIDPTPLHDWLKGD